MDTGKVLWKGKTAGQSIGIPAMYESKGRQYVVFMSPAVGAGRRRRRPGRRHERRAGEPDRPVRLHRVRVATVSDGAVATDVAAGLQPRGCAAG